MVAKKEGQKGKKKGPTRLWISFRWPSRFWGIPRLSSSPRAPPIPPSFERSLRWPPHCFPRSLSLVIFGDWESSHPVPSSKCRLGKKVGSRVPPLDSYLTDCSVLRPYLVDSNTCPTTGPSLPKWRHAHAPTPWYWGADRLGRARFSGSWMVCGNCGADRRCLIAGLHERPSVDGAAGETKF